MESLKDKFLFQFFFILLKTKHMILVYSWGGDQAVECSGTTEARTLGCLDGPDTSGISTQGALHMLNIGSSN